MYGQQSMQEATTQNKSVPITVEFTLEDAYLYLEFLQTALLKIVVTKEHYRDDTRFNQFLKTSERIERAIKEALGER